MAYGDDLASPVQRRVAIAAVMLALLELAYGWLVAGMMAAAPNPRLTATSSVLALIIVANSVLMFGRARPASHWLRVFSPASIALMVVGPAVLVLVAIAHDGS
jgi:lipoprotein signal peptidase